MVLITIVMGVYKPTYNWGAPHCMNIYTMFQSVDGPSAQVDIYRVDPKLRRWNDAWRRAR